MRSESIQRIAAGSFEGRHQPLKKIPNRFRQSGAAGDGGGKPSRLTDRAVRFQAQPEDPEATQQDTLAVPGSEIT
jgi:hypothetical protein